MHYYNCYFGASPQILKKNTFSGSIWGKSMIQTVNYYYQLLLALAKYCVHLYCRCEVLSKDVFHVDVQNMHQGRMVSRTKIHGETQARFRP